MDPEFGFTGLKAGGRQRFEASFWTSSHNQFQAHAHNQFGWRSGWEHDQFIVSIGLYDSFKDRFVARCGLR
jgi:hypothetical protein